MADEPKRTNLSERDEIDRLRNEALKTIEESRTKLGEKELQLATKEQKLYTRSQTLDEREKQIEKDAEELVRRKQKAVQKENHVPLTTRFLKAAADSKPVVYTKRAAIALALYTAFAAAIGFVGGGIANTTSEPIEKAVDTYLINEIDNVSLTSDNYCHYLDQDKKLHVTFEEQAGNNITNVFKWFFGQYEDLKVHDLGTYPYITSNLCDNLNLGEKALTDEQVRDIKRDYLQELSNSKELSQALKTSQHDGWIYEYEVPAMRH